MATYSTDLTTLTTAESGTWTEFASPYNGGGTPASNTEAFIQGTACYSQTTGKAVGLEISIVFDYGSGYSFSAGDVVYAWCFYANGVNLETYANNGWRFGIGSSISAWDWFRIGGSDYGRNPYGGWFNVAIDPTATESGTVGGGNGGTYRYFGSVPYTLGEVTKGEPSAVDAIRVGRGLLSITGTGGSFAELAAYNDYNGGGTPPGTSSTSIDSGRHRLGIFQAQGKGFLFKGLLSFGTSGASVTFSDSNKSITIDDCPHTYAAFNKIEVHNASSSVTLNTITFTSGATTANGKGYFEMVDNATVSLLGCSFIDMGTFIFLSNGTITGGKFVNCGQITHGGATFTGVEFTGYEGTVDTGYLIYNINADIDGELDGCKFTKGTASTHAIQFGTSAATTQTIRDVAFSGYNATHEQTDSTLYFPDKGSDTTWTINLVGCSGNISYKKARAGDTVNLVTNPVTVLITVKDESTDNTITGAAVTMKAGNTASGLPYQDSVSITSGSSLEDSVTTSTGIISMGVYDGFGQVFQATNSQALVVAEFSMYRYNTMPPDRLMWAELWSVTGTPGTDGKPSALLATSIKRFAAELVTSGEQWEQFYFPSGQQYQLTASTWYVIVVRDDSDDTLERPYVGRDQTPVHGGNAVLHIYGLAPTNWSANTEYDFLFRVYTGSTLTATVTHTGHGLSTGQKVEIAGANERGYNRIKTITKISDNSYSYNMGEYALSPATGTIVATAIIIDGETDTNGQISDSRSYAVDQLYTGTVQRGTKSPIYKARPISGTIDKDIGLSLDVLLTQD